ncbi:type II toxin-antitoxin system RelE/ParE family toxin [Amphibiibacter pelophylacis]|uniref:Type II toxin-antitoxin system RelE/ParE family toxin n=1 Tax=Amphibiibacter pelophylacis TaxID=1799477 RepID=A0ACC6NZZ3_9BURK
MTGVPYRIEWRPAARDDLEGLVHHIARDSPLAAVRFGQKLHDQTLLLALQPELGRTGRPGLPGFLREWVAHPNYLIFYRVLEQTRTVQILRVKHVARQAP